MTVAGERAHRIAIVAPLPPWRGGISHHSMMLGEALARRAKVFGFTFSRLYPGAVFPGKDQRDPTGRRARFDVVEVVDSMAPLSWRGAAQSIKAFGPSIVVVAWWHPAFAPALTAVAAKARRDGARVVMVVHNAEPHARFPFSKALTRWALRHADGFVAMTGHVFDEALRMAPGVPARIAGHPPYTQFDSGRHTRETARAALRLGPEPIVLFFGMVRRYKKLARLLDVWPMVHANTKATLLVAGEFYDDESRLRRTAEHLKGVKLTGRYAPDDEVEALFRAADVLAMPYEPRSQSGAESTAEAFGVPVVIGPADLGERLIRALHIPTKPAPSGATWGAMASAVIDVSQNDYWCAQ